MHTGRTDRLLDGFFVTRTLLMVSFPLKRVNVISPEKTCTLHTTRLFVFSAFDDNNAFKGSTKGVCLRRHPLTNDSPKVARLPLKQKSAIVQTYRHDDHEDSPAKDQHKRQHRCT